jgi:hypothetical protein
MDKKKTQEDIETTKWNQRGFQQTLKWNQGNYIYIKRDKWNKGSIRCERGA